MWFSRIISSFFGIRKKNDLEDDLNKISFTKLIVLFISLNLIFIAIVFFITKIFV